MEKLEGREMMAVIPIVSGQTTTFHDADGTQVTVKLVGPGECLLELDNGQLTGAGIDNLVLSNTTGTSKLKISTRGGSVSGTTINELVITKALNELGALKHLKAKNLDFVGGGQFVADGDIEDIRFRSLGVDASIDVAGSVGRLEADTLQSDASIEVGGTLHKFVAQLLNTGSQVSASQLNMLKVKQQAQGATFDVGVGGLGQAKIKNFYNSAIASDGGIGEVLVKGEITGSALAANIDKGSDGIFGTIDDFVVDQSAAGNINAVKFRGKVGETGTSEEVNIVTSGLVGRLYLSREAERLNTTPTIWTQAASQFVALSILQGTGNVAMGQTATGYADDEIWIAVFGEEILTPPPGVTPAATPFTTYYLDPTSLQGTIPVAINTQSLQPSATTPDQAILPSFTIEQWKDTTGQKIWGSNLAFPAPTPGNQWTGRILISVGAPVQAQVNSLNGTVSSPSASDLTDPSTGTFYDFLEFTVTNPNPTSAVSPNNLAPPSIDIDTSLVDSFGIPMELQLYKDAAATLPYNISFTGTITTFTGSNVITGVTNLNDLVKTQGLGTGQPLTSTTANAIQPGTIITGYDVDALTITMSLPATGSGSVPLTAYAAGPVGVEATRHSILANASSASLVQFIKQEIASGATQAQAFLQSAAAYPKTAAVAITGASYPASPIQITTGSTAGLADGDVVLISGVVGNTAANGLLTVSNVTATTFTLDSSTGNAAYMNGGTWTAFTNGGRMVSPKDVVEALSSAQDPSALNNYYNEVIDDFFVQYSATTVPIANNGTPGNQTFSLVSTAFNGTNITYSGQVQLDDTYNAYALTLTDSTNTDTNTYKIYYPFFQQNAPAGYIYMPQLSVLSPPPWITEKNWQDESASQMIFACDALFADNIVRKSYDMNASSAPVLGDLENSISAAFNRGISLLPASGWDEVTSWFPANGTYNYWVQYWHQQGMTFNDLAYAFPYDDKFGASTNLDIQGVGLTQITLGSWSATAGASTTAFQTIPSTSASQGQVTLAAQVSGTNPTGTVSFFIDGVAINANDGSSSPPIQQLAVNGSGLATLTAELPQLPAGAARHTYTVTAVYSGDANNLPSIAYDSLQIVEPIAVTITPNGGVLGSSVELQATLPGSDFAGSLTFSIAHSDGTGSEMLTSVTPTSVNVTVPSAAIPQNLLQFTGNTTSGSPTITGVSSVVDLQAGQTIMGAGIPTGATIQSVNTGLNTVTLNTNATATSNSAVTFTSNGAGAGFVITANFAPSGSGNPSAGAAILNVTAEPYSLLLAPGSGALGFEPTMTVTLPGPLYNGTVEFFISLSDGTESQSLGTVNVNSSTLSNGNQIVVDNLAIPADLLTFTAYSDGSGTLTGLSTISNLVPNIQNVSGGGVTTNTLAGYTSATLTLTNPAAATSTVPVTFTADGVTITGMTTQGQQAVQVTSVSGWTLTTILTSVSITDNAQNQFVGANNTIQTFTPTTATTSTPVPASASQITFTSGANGQTYPITATWTPTDGTPLSTSQLFAVSL